MTTKLEKCARLVNDQFGDTLVTEFAKKFGRTLVYEWNIFAMQAVSRPADGKPFTVKQKDWLQAFDEGYSAAMSIVRTTAHNDNPLFKAPR